MKLKIFLRTLILLLLSLKIPKQAAAMKIILAGHTYFRKTELSGNKILSKTRKSKAVNKNSNL
jgi:hypothetical protein